MIAYRLFWLLKTEGYLYLVTNGQREDCAILMTASKPKKVRRSITLGINPDDAVLLYEGKDGGILWRCPLPLQRSESGALQADVTDILRSADVDFAFCEPGKLRTYQSRPYELWRRMDLYPWGCLRATEGFALDAPASAAFSSSTTRALVAFSFAAPSSFEARYASAAALNSSEAFSEAIISST